MSNCNLKLGDSLSDRTLISTIPNNTTVSSKKYIAKSGDFDCIAEELTNGTTTGYIQYKAPGIEWYQSNITNTYIGEVKYANDLWVAAGVIGLYYSDDGINWDQSNSTDSYHFNCVSYGNGKWVAYSDVNIGIWYSTDGITWTQSNITDKIFHKIIYGADKWVASSDSDGIYYSTDGQTWNSSNTTTGTFNGLCYANNKWVVCSSTSGLYYSADGITWTQSNVTSGNFNNVYYANNVWIVVGVDGAYYSSDGITWNQSNIGDSRLNVANFGGSKWVAGGPSNRGIYYSSDGITWTQSNNTNSHIISIVYGDNKWVAASHSGDEGIYYSMDGITWTQSNITSGEFSCVGYDDNGTWVAGGFVGLLYSFNFSLQKDIFYEGTSSITTINNSSIGIPDDFGTITEVDKTAVFYPYIKRGTNEKVYVFSEDSDKIESKTKTQIKDQINGYMQDIERKFNPTN